jgi:hypothetical protein
MRAGGANTTNIAAIGSNTDVPVPMNRCRSAPYRRIKVVTTANPRSYGPLQAKVNNTNRCALLSGKQQREQSAKDHTADEYRPFGRVQAK